MQRNVSKAVVLPRIGEPETRALTVDEQDAFLLALKDDRLGPAFILLLGSGIRRSELLGLRWQDVNLDTGVIKIREGVTYTKENGLSRDATKTKKGRRDVPVTSWAVAALKSHKERMLSEGYCGQKQLKYFKSSRKSYPKRKVKRVPISRNPLYYWWVQ